MWAWHENSSVIQRRSWNNRNPATLSSLPSPHKSNVFQVPNVFWHLWKNLSLDIRSEWIPTAFFVLVKLFFASTQFLTMSMFSAEYPHPKFQFIVIMCIKVALCIDRVPIWFEKVSKWLGEPDYLVYGAHIHVFAMEFYPDRRITVSTCRAPVSCLKSIFQGEITQLCLSPSQKVRGTLLQSFFTYIKWEYILTYMCVRSWVSE